MDLRLWNLPNLLLVGLVFAAALTTFHFICKPISKGT